jgi:hypothetical protein
MARLDLSRATTRIDMTDTTLTTFATAELTTPRSWSFNNGRSDDLQLDGKGMSFNAAGRAATGTVTKISIDLGDNDADNPDIVITGIKAKASLLDNGTKVFWRSTLEGNDTIIGPSVDPSVGAHILLGDVSEARPGSMRGSNDTFHLGKARVDDDERRL